VLKPVAFWDASALATLCVTLKVTPQALMFEGNYRIAVWWGTPVEIASALAQLLRRMEITPAMFTQAKLQAGGLANLWDVVQPSTKIALDACVVVERYPLRAADALQLAAARAWCAGKPNGKVFLTFDRRLREAAELAGFTLL
jgi:predicted nucleic acid-binding protein